MNVAIVKDEKMSYNIASPFNPSQDYPEYPFKGNLSDSNSTYGQVRELFRVLGLDKDNYGTERWNPLGDIIVPGNKVFLKPNWVCHFYRKRMDISAMVASSAVTRAVLDYVYIALKGKGSITIGDAPIDVADFGKIVKILSVDSIIDFYKNHNVEIGIVDLRNEMAIKEKGMIIKRIKLKGDPLGYTVIDLGRGSELSDIDKDFSRFRGLEYDPNCIVSHHDGKKNEYIIPNSILAADVIINLPKLKTHRKAGMTCALKNMIGIMSAKEWLVHHRKGPKDAGFDEYLHTDWRKEQMSNFTDIIDSSKNQLERRFFQVLRKLFRLSGKLVPFNCPYFEGSWWGNQTISKTITDLNKIVFYVSKDGKMQKTMQRKMFILVDAVIAGEGEGPLEPTPKKCGMLIAGDNPVAVDLVCSRIMGFDYRKIPTLMQASKTSGYKLLDLPVDKLVLSDNDAHFFNDITKFYNYHFKPTRGWQGFIELEE